ALGAVRSPATLPLLLEHATARQGLFRRDRLASKSPEMLAALTALATSWAAHADAAAALALAAGSEDPEVRAAVRRKGPR
ncbi:MAG TPA: hypothetical protein VGR60_08560, partial [Gemmatimonadales bacterium]|nr:hypothetical protein [Gemmatimonadales bacterium]